MFSSSKKIYCRVFVQTELLIICLETNLCNLLLGNLQSGWGQHWHCCQGARQVGPPTLSVVVLSLLYLLTRLLNHSKNPYCDIYCQYIPHKFWTGVVAMTLPKVGRTIVTLHSGDLILICLAWLWCQFDRIFFYSKALVWLNNDSGKPLPTQPSMCQNTCSTTMILAL